uniref:Cancer susceptibility candidate protein 1 n=1 Tax=Echinococcus granulosus TaxID=6210 RepID=A0A068WF67_ECHGR|nr:cancer susceptibility candidate protein 1 [Echinococcus granulosus]
MPKLTHKEEEARKKEEERRLIAEKEAASKAAAKLAELQRLRELEIAEIKFRKAELDETRELLSRHHQALDKIQRERADDYIWYRYLLCDGLPNPIIEREINTYMSLWRTNEDRISMEDVMVDSVNAMKLIDELQTLIADLDENYSELERYRKVMQELRELVQEKVNRACVETLTKASHYADPETANLQKIRRYTFEETGITFSIPRVLTLSDCAFRIVFMKFDTYSVTSLSYRPRVYNGSEEKVSSITTIEGVRKGVADSAVAGLNGKPTGAEDGKEIGMAGKLEVKEENMKEEMRAAGEIEEMQKPANGTNATKVDTKSSVNIFDLLIEEQKEGVVEEEHKEEEKVVEIPEEDRAETPTKPLWSPIPLPEDAIDLCDYHVVGGVFQFDLLKLPRQPRMGRGWRWTNCVVPPLLTPFEYIVDTPQLEDEETETEEEGKAEEVKEGLEGQEQEEKGGQSQEEGTEQTVAEGGEVTAVNTDGTSVPVELDTDAPLDLHPSATSIKRIDAPEPNPPVEVKLRLPDCLIIPEEPVLACWDPENLIWRTNGVVINQFTPELNEISFITAVFGTFAVFQDFYLNMPFQHWEMRPLPRRVIKAQTEIAEVAGTNPSDKDMEPLPLDSSAPPEAANTAQQPPQRASQTNLAPQALPPPQPPVSVAAAAPLEIAAAAARGDEVTVATANGGAAAASPSLHPPPQMPAQPDALGPLDSMGVPDEIFLADKTEADQCLITITGAYIRVHLHVLDDRVAILAEDPKAILDPLKMAEEEAAAAAKAAGVATAPTATSDEAVDEAAVTTPATARRRLGGGGAAGPRASRVGAAIGGAVTDEGLGGQLELEHLTGRWFTPDELTCVLTASGVNIFPRPDSGTRVECIEKNPLTEQRLYEQMALLSPVMAFGWSHWNSACQDPSSIILVGAEHLDEDGPVDEERWRVYLMNRKYVYQLQIPESGDKFRPDPEPTLHRHADFYHMYMEIGSDKGKERVQGIQSRYFKTRQNKHVILFTYYSPGHLDRGWKLYN